MIMSFGIIVLGVLLTVWGFYSMKPSKHDLIKNNNAANIVDIVINGWGSGLGMFVSGIICIIIGIVSFFVK